MQRGAACWLVLILSVGWAVAGEAHPFSIHDMLAMDRIADPQPSPDGRHVAFVRRTTDLEADQGRTDLWLVTVTDGALRRLTSHPAGDHDPRWSPDGKGLYFLSGRSESSQIWRMAVDGGEAVQVSDFPVDVTSLAVSPDGKRLAFSADVFPDCADLDCTAARLQEIEDNPVSARVYESLFIRHWDTWKDGRRAHLFVVPAEGGIPVDVMRGMQADCPSKPFGGPEEYTFTPDGKGLVFSTRDAGASEAWSTDFDLYHAAVDGSAAPRCLTEPNEAWDTQPVFSPDGKTLAYLAMREPGYESDRLRVVLRSWPDGRERVLTETWDRSPRGLAWSADGSTLYANAYNLGQRSLFAIDGCTERMHTGW